MAEIGGIGDVLDSLTSDLVATGSCGQFEPARLIGGCHSVGLGSGIKEIADSRAGRTPLNKSNMPDTNIELIIGVEIAELVIVAWLEPLVKLNCQIQFARAFLWARVQQSA